VRNWTRQGSKLGALAIVGLLLLSATVGSHCRIRVRAA
jgi:hypothetical protein